MKWLILVLLNLAMAGLNFSVATGWDLNMVIGMVCVFVAGIPFTRLVDQLLNA